MVPEAMEIYHFPVIGSAPFFVRGLIRRGISGSFTPTVREDRAAVLFVRDSDVFARSAGIPLDDQPSLALVLPGGITAGYLKGPVNEKNIEMLRKLLEAYIP